MAKQLLIYGSVTPVSPGKHANWSVKTGDDYKFAKNINSVPVMAAEFPNIASDNAIVFTGDDKQVMPVVIMGVREGENLFVDDKGTWNARYVPAFLRRYPFVFSSKDAGKSFTLCIDEEFTGFNQQGRGERLFDDTGEQTRYLKNVLDFLKEYQVHYRRTENFSKKLLDLDLLEPMTAQFKSPDGTAANLTGFMAVNREKIKALSGDKMKELAATDELELIYVHIQSMLNFPRMIEKMYPSEESGAQSAGVRQNAKLTTKKKAAAKKVSRAAAAGPAGKKKTTKK